MTVANMVYRKFELVMWIRKLYVNVYVRVLTSFCYCLLLRGMKKVYI